jgi:tRNA/tmRNA/rRNA uracil-C5-methylase (TrmA/RlmC/RlmD family)
MARLDPAGLVGLELAESLSGDARVCHLEFAHAPHVDAWPAMLAGVAGASWGGPGAKAEGGPLLGEPVVWDELALVGTDGARTLRLRHHVRSFFQGNRFLVGRLANMVAQDVAGGPALDLYAGTGLLGLSAAAVRAIPVTLVEGDHWSSRDLASNVPEGSPGLRVEASSVEAYVSRRRLGFATWIVDPPRQGLSSDVRLAVLRDRPSRLVYVSCDVATLARDVAALTTGGYEVRSLVGLDLFPSTAHVETVCVLDAAGP